MVCDYLLGAEHCDAVPELRKVPETQPCTEHQNELITRPMCLSNIMSIPIQANFVPLNLVLTTANIITYILHNLVLRWTLRYTAVATHFFYGCI